MHRLHSYVSYTDLQASTVHILQASDFHNHYLLVLSRNLALVWLWSFLSLHIDKIPIHHSNKKIVPQSDHLLPQYSVSLLLLSIHVMTWYLQDHPAKYSCFLHNHLLELFSHQMQLQTQLLQNILLFLSEMTRSLNKLLVQQYLHPVSDTRLPAMVLHLSVTLFFLFVCHLY